MSRVLTLSYARCAWATLCILVMGSAGFGGVTGIVSDSTTGTPLVLAWVKFGVVDSVQTTATGAYSFPNLAAGTYAVVVRRTGYWNHRQQVTLAPGNNTANFQMLPLNLPVNPVGLWTFENASVLTQAEVGNDLVLQGTHQAVAGPGGTGAVNIGVGSYYHCYHDIPANGGSTTWVNEYSLLIDFRVSQLGRWYTFFQTNASNSNDGDGFINTSGNIGVAITGYSSYAIVPNEWYRLIISADLGSNYKYYLDGQLLHDGGAQILNGRFALYPAGNGNQVLLFADDDGEDNALDVAQVADYDSPLSAIQASVLGGYGHLIVDPATVMTPYLQSPTATTICVSWHYQPSLESFVDFGTTEALGRTASGSTQSLNPATIWHTVQLSDMQPATTYYYRCRSDTATTPLAHFRTPPAVGSRSGKLRFMLISDSHASNTHSFEVASAMRQTMINRYGTDFADSVNLIIHCGDLVDNGADLASYQSAYFLRFAEINRSIPFMVSIGNHELESSNFYNYMKYEQFGGPEGELYYSFQMGRVLFMVLNSNTQGTTQANWCSTRLSQAQSDTTIDMVFVATHKPGHSEIWPDGNTAWVQNTILPILEGYPKVVMISHGHSHCYERGARSAGNLRTVICGGAGGAPDRWRMYANQTDYAETHRSFDYYNYILVEVDLANRSYEATAYTLGNDDHPLAIVPFDYWRQSLGQAAPQTPLGNSPMGDVAGPVTLMSSAFAGADTIQSSEFQLTATPGNYASPMLDVNRDFEDYYYDTGTPDYEAINRNAGIQLGQFGRVDSLLAANGTYGWRVRYRDRNLQWSSWSEERTFIWRGIQLPETPQHLTLAASPTVAVLRWHRVAGTGVQYNVYRDSTATGTFQHLAGTTADTTFVDSIGVIPTNVQGYYIVKTIRP